jgi:hypothetical protein
MESNTVVCDTCRHYDANEQWCTMWDVSVPQADDSHCDQYNYPMS